MTPNNINPNSANSDTKQEEHITFSVHDLIPVSYTHLTLPTT